MDKLDIEKVCRTCVSVQEGMSNINDSVDCNGTTLTIKKVLNSFLSQEVSC